VKLFDSLRHRARVSTVVFFGVRNQVLGFPDHIRETADVMKARKLTKEQVIPDELLSTADLDVHLTPEQRAILMVLGYTAACLAIATIVFGRKEL